MYTCKRHKKICPKNPNNQRSKIAGVPLVRHEVPKTTQPETTQPGTTHPRNNEQSPPATLNNDDVCTPKTIIDVSQISKSKKRKLPETLNKQYKIIKISNGKQSAEI